MLILVTVAASIVLSPLALRLAGEGDQPAGPIPSHYVIAVVPTTFWLAIMFGGWPFTAMTRNPMVSGLLVLVAAYVVTYLIFRVVLQLRIPGGRAGLPRLRAARPVQRGDARSCST